MENAEPDTNSIRGLVDIIPYIKESGTFGRYGSQYSSDGSISIDFFGFSQEMTANGIYLQTMESKAYETS